MTLWARPPGSSNTLYTYLILVALSLELVLQLELDWTEVAAVVLYRHVTLHTITANLSRSVQFAIQSISTLVLTCCLPYIAHVNAIQL